MKHYLTLLFLSFASLQGAATEIFDDSELPISEEINDDLIIDFGDVSESRRIIDSNGKKIAVLVVNEKAVHFKSIIDKPIHIRNVPTVSGLVVESPNKVIFEDKITCTNGANFNIAKGCVFKKGLEITNPKGAVKLEGRGYAFGANSKIPHLVGKCQDFTVSKDVFVDIRSAGDFEVTRSLSNAGDLHLGKGSLIVSNFVNNKEFCAGNLVLQIKTSVTNNGDFSVDCLKITPDSKSFVNNESGILTIKDFCQGRLNQLFLYGKSNWNGAALLQVNEVRFRSEVTAHCLRLESPNTIHVLKGSHFHISKHMSLETNQSTHFEGEIHFKSTRKDTKRLTGSQNFIAASPIGVYLSAKNTLGQQGVVKVDAGDIHFTSGGKFTDLNGFTQTGVFKTCDARIIAQKAELMGKIAVQSNTTVFAKDMLLGGERDGSASLFLAATGTIKQLAGDHNTVKSIYMEGQHLYLGGHNKTKETQTLKASQDVIFEGTSQTQAKSLHVQGDRIIDETGAKTVVADSILKKAETHLETQVGSTSSATKTQLVSDGTMSIGGKSESEKDTQFIAKDALTIAETSHTKAANLSTESDSLQLQKGSAFAISGTRHHKTEKDQVIESPISGVRTILESTEGDVDIASKVKSSDATIVKAQNITVRKTGDVESGNLTSFDAKKRVKIDGKMSSKRTLLKGGQRVIVDGGKVHSDEVLQVDTKWYTNKNKGSVTSHERLTINADRAALSLRANTAAKNLEINTLLNLSLFSRNKGSESFTINALVNAGFFNLNQSHNYTVNALLNVSEFGFTSFALPSFDKGIGGFCESIAWQVGRTAIGQLPGPWGSAAKLAWSVKDLTRDVSSLLTPVAQGDEVYRPSMIMKKMGQAITAATTAKTTFNHASGLYGDLNPPEAPPPSETPPTPKTEQLDSFAPLWSCSRFLAEEGLSSAKSHILPTAKINALFNIQGRRSRTLMGYVIEKVGYTNDESTVYANSHVADVLTGSRHGRDVTFSSSYTSLGAFSIGGQQDISGSLSVNAGGDLTLDESLKAKVKDRAHFKSGKSIMSAAGSEVNAGEKAIQEAKEDIDHFGKMHGDQGSTLQAEGVATQKAGSSLTATKDNVFVDGKLGASTEAGSTQQTEDGKVIVQSKDGDAVHGGKAAASQDIDVYSENGLALMTSTSGANTTGKVNIQGKKARTEVGSTQDGQKVSVYATDGDAEHGGTAHAKEGAAVFAQNGVATQLAGSTLHTETGESVIQGTKGTTTQKDAITKSDMGVTTVGIKGADTNHGGVAHGGDGTNIIGRDVHFGENSSSTTGNGKPVLIEVERHLTAEKGAHWSSSVPVEPKEDTPSDQPAIQPAPPTEPLADAGSEQKNNMGCDPSQLRRGKGPLPSDEKNDDKKDDTKGATPPIDPRQLLRGRGSIPAPKHHRKKHHRKKHRKHHDETETTVADEPTSELAASETPEEPSKEPEDTEPAPPPPGFVQVNAGGNVTLNNTVETNNLLIKSGGKTTLGESFDGTVSERTDFIANGFESHEDAKLDCPVTLKNIDGDMDDHMKVSGGEGSIQAIIHKNGHLVLGLDVQTTGFNLKSDRVPVFTDTFNSDAKNISLDAPNIADIPALMQKQGPIGEAFQKAESIDIKTTGHVDFLKSQHSAFQTFGLKTDTFTLGEDVKLSADVGIILHALTGDATFKAGSGVKGGVFYNIAAPKGYVRCEHKLEKTKWDTDHTRGAVKDASLKSVTFEGGKGIPYVYEDPETGELFLRYLAGSVTAGKKVTGTAVTYEGIGDVYVSGRRGVENFGIAQKYLSDYKKDKGRTRTKRTYYLDTLFFEGGFRSSGGKLIIESEKGGFLQDAGYIQAADGIDNYTRDNIETRALIGKKGKKTNRDSKFGTGIFQKSDETFWSEIASTTKETVRQGAVRHVSENGRVKMHGIQMYAPNSKVTIWGAKGREFDCPILKSHYERTGWNWTPQLPSSFNDLRPNIQSSYAALGQFADGNFTQGASTLYPTMGVNFGYGHAQSDWKSVHQGFIVAGSWEGRGDDGSPVHQKNGFRIKVLGDMSGEEQTDWKISAARLHSSSSNWNIAGFVGMQGVEPVASINVSASNTVGKTHQNGALEVGGTLTGLRELTVDGGTVDIKELDGEIGKINATTHQDTSTTMHASLGVNYNGATTVSAGYNTTRTNAETTAITIGHATKNSKIGGGHLKGAEVVVESKDEGAEIGKFTHENLKEEGTKGVSITLTHNPNAPDSSGDPRKLINQVGTLSVNGTDLPIITQINVDNILNLPNQVVQDIQQAGHNFAELVMPAKQVLPTDIPSSQPTPMPVIVEEPLPADIQVREWSIIEDAEPVVPVGYTEHPYVDESSSGDSYQHLAAIPLFAGVKRALNAKEGIEASQTTTKTMQLETLEKSIYVEKGGLDRHVEHKVVGKNIFIENPEHLGAVEEAFDAVKSSRSEFTKLSTTFLEKGQLTGRRVFVMDLKKFIIGSDAFYDSLSRDIFLAGLQNNQFSLAQYLSHESQHAYAHFYNGLNSNPCKTLTQQIELFQSFCRDLKLNGYNDFTSTFANPEAELVFGRPYRYYQKGFEDAFRNNYLTVTNDNSALLSLLSDHQNRHLEGQSFTLLVLKDPANATLFDKFGASGEQFVVTEIPAWAATLEVNTPGRFKDIAPNTYNTLNKFGYFKSAKVDFSLARGSSKGLLYSMSIDESTPLLLAGNNSAQSSGLAQRLPAVLTPKKEYSLERLSTPFEIRIGKQSKFFRFGIKGLEIYIENPDHMLKASDALNKISDSNSPLVQLSNRYINETDSPIVVLNNSQVSDHAEGIYKTASKEILVAGEPKTSTLPQILAHEPIHAITHIYNGGDTHIPCRSPAEQIEMIQCVGIDLRRFALKQGVDPLAIISKGPVSEPLFFKPSQYIQVSLQGSLSVHHCTPQEIEDATRLYKRWITEGRSALIQSDMLHQLYPESRNVINHAFNIDAFNKAEESYLAEIVAWGASFDVEKSGHFTSTMPHTYDWLCHRGFFGDILPNRPIHFPMGQVLNHRGSPDSLFSITAGTATSKPNVGIENIITKLNDLNPRGGLVTEIQAKPISVTPCRRDLTPGAGLKKCGAKALLPAIDIVLNTWEQTMQGEQPSDAFARGLIKTGADVGTYGMFYGYITCCAGGPAGMGVGGAALFISAVPEFDPVLAAQMDDIYYRNPHLMAVSPLPSAEWRFYEGIKKILHAPEHASQWVMTQIDHYCPEVPSFMGRVGKFIGNGINEHTRINRHAKTIQLPGHKTPPSELPLIEVKTPDVWWKEAGEQQEVSDTNRRIRRMQAHDAPEM